jgi:hypothetical protein
MMGRTREKIIILDTSVNACLWGAFCGLQRWGNSTDQDGITGKLMRDELQVADGPLCFGIWSHIAWLGGCPMDAWRANVMSVH